MASGDDLQKALEERLNYYGSMLLDEDEHNKALKKAQRKVKPTVTVKSSTQKKSKSNISKDKSLKKSKRSIKKPQNRHLSGLRESLEKFDSVISSKKLQATEDKRSRERTSVGIKTSSRFTSEPEVVVYHNPSKKRKLQESSDEDDEQGAPQARFSMKLARQDVNKLGISGFVKTKREEAQSALAIKLGAKPPKKEYVNYKLLQEKKKKEKADFEQTLTEARQHGLNLKNKKFKGKEKVQKIKKELGFVDGQVGTYKDGVHFLSKSDVERIKTTKVSQKFKRR